jgi:hypothetical protein
MNATIETTRKSPEICASKDEFLETLFRPGGTADGYVIRRRKHFCDIWLLGKEYRINHWLVLCERTPCGEWTFAGKLPWGNIGMDAAFRELVVGCEWRGNEIMRFFAK